MSLADVKTAFDALPLEGESRKFVDDIVNASIARGGMTGEERQKLFQALEIEEGLADIELSAAEDALRASIELGNDVAAVYESAAQDIEKAAGT